MFDPYHKWLGIPKDQRPPTLYQLLGITPGEEDVEVIEEAAIRQTTHVRAYQIGAHSQECTRLLNEISQARSTLTNPAKRKQYDATLGQKAREKLAAMPMPANQVTASGPMPKAAEIFAELETPEMVATARKPVSRPGRPQSKGLVYLAAGGGAVAVLAIVLIAILSGKKPDNQQVQNPDKAKAKEKVNQKKNQEKNAKKDPLVKNNKEKVDDDKKGGVVKQEDNKLAAKVLGRYQLTFQEATGPHKGATRWQFTQERAIENGRDRGTWRIKGGKVIIIYSQTHLGQAELEFQDDNTLVGKHKQTNGQVFNWRLEREGMWIEPRLILNGKENMVVGPSPLDKLDPDKIAPEDRLEKIPELVAVLKGPKREIFGVAFSPDGTKIASAGNDGHLFLWNLNGAEFGPGLDLGQTGGTLSSVAFSRNGTKLATANHSRAVIFDVSTAQPKKFLEIESLKAAPFPGVAFSPNGNTLAITDNGGVRLFDLSGGQAKERPMLRRPAGHVKTVYFNRDGTWMLAGSWEARGGRITLWDWKVIPPSPEITSQGEEQVFHAVFSPDGKKIAYSTTAGVVHVLDSKLGGIWQKKEHRQWANSVCFAPDSKTLISTEGGANPQGPHYLIWWNAANGKVLKKWELPERCSQGVFAPSGLYVALTNHNHKVYILRLKAD